jgi:hypothetical protein
MEMGDGNDRENKRTENWKARKRKERLGKRENEENRLVNFENGETGTGPRANRFAILS